MALTVVRVLLGLQTNITNPSRNKSEGPVAWTRRGGDGLHASCVHARRLSRRVARPHRCQGDRQCDRQGDRQQGELGGQGTRGEVMTVDYFDTAPVSWGERVGEELGGVESSSRGVS